LTSWISAAAGKVSSRQSPRSSRPACMGLLFISSSLDGLLSGSNQRPLDPLCRDGTGPPLVGELRTIPNVNIIVKRNFSVWGVPVERCSQERKRSGLQKGAESGCSRADSLFQSRNEPEGTFSSNGGRSPQAMWRSRSETARNMRFLAWLSRLAASLSVIALAMSSKHSKVMSAFR